nr:MAG TPA: Single strand binding protein [Caudoviricetes sp.]
MYNYLTIVGNLTKDPEQFLSKDNNGCVRFTIANNYRKEASPIFLDVVVFGKLCDVAVQLLRKGTKCLIGGRLEANIWEDDTGKKRTSLTLIGFSLECLSPREAHSASEDEEDDKLPF